MIIPPSQNSRVYFSAIICIFVLTTIPKCIYAQDDLIKILEEQETKETQYVGQTFKGSRLVNGQSVETQGKGELEVIFSHRFGTLNSGAYNFWGMDEAVMRMGLEYGITDRLGISIGRSSSDKTIDGYLKYKIARQSTGVGHFPFTITAVGSGAIKTSPKASPDADIAFVDRVAYVGEVMIARKMSPTISLQLTPIIIHRNSVNSSYENNDDVALAFGERYKVTRSFTLTAEYFYRVNPHTNTPYYNAFGFGFDLETGGHVFQMVFTNSLGMIDRTIITETTGKLDAGDIHFGFNITRSFSVGRKRLK